VHGLRLLCQRTSTGLKTKLYDFSPIPKSESNSSGTFFENCDQHFQREREITPQKTRLWFPMPLWPAVLPLFGLGLLPHFLMTYQGVIAHQNQNVWGVIERNQMRVSGVLPDFPAYQPCFFQFMQPVIVGGKRNPFNLIHPDHFLYRYSRNLRRFFIGTENHTIGIHRKIGRGCLIIERTELLFAFSECLF